MKKAIISAVSLFVFLTAGFAKDNAYLSDETYKALQEKGSLIRWVIEDNATLDFINCPDTELCKNSLKTWEKSENPSFISENLYLVSKETIKERSVAKNDVDFSVEKVGQIIRSISKMKGMKYYSNSKKKWQTLYHKANRIKSPEDKKALKDEIEGSAEGYSTFCILDDNTFGEGVYKASYSQRENEVTVTLTNYEALKLGFISGVKAKDLVINLTVIENGDNYIIYMICRAKYPVVKLLENTLKKSFDARIDAIFNWFTYQF